MAGLAFRHDNRELASKLFRAAVRRRRFSAANSIDNLPDSPAVVRVHQKNHEQTARAAEIRVQVDENQAGKSRAEIFAVRYKTPRKGGSRLKTFRAGKIQKPALNVDALDVGAEAHQLFHKIIVAAVDVVNVANLRFALRNQSG